MRRRRRHEDWHGKCAAADGIKTGMESEVQCHNLIKRRIEYNNPFYEVPYVI